MRQLINIVIAVLAFSVNSFSVSAQIIEEHGTVTINGVIMPVVYTEFDTILLADEAYLTPIVVTAPRLFTNSAERNLYYKYRRYAAIVYPYGKKAIKIFRELEATTEGMKPRKRKKEVKRLQKELKKEFMDQLKGLTKTQGRILVNMIEKELDQPLYDLLKEWRGGLSARYWQTVGSMFSYDLKEGYIIGKDPILDMVLEDFDISYGYD